MIYSVLFCEYWPVIFFFILSWIFPFFFFHLLKPMRNNTFNKSCRYPVMLLIQLNNTFYHAEFHHIFCRYFCRSVLTTLESFLVPTPAFLYRRVRYFNNRSYISCCITHVFNLKKDATSDGKKHISVYLHQSFFWQTSQLILHVY